MDAKTIRGVAEAARRRLTLAADPPLAAQRIARTGTPAPVHAPHGDVAFYLVPLVHAGRALGYVMVSPAGEATSISSFATSDGDREGGIAAGYFKQPPAVFVRELQGKQPGRRLFKAIFSYDGSPARWGWRIDFVEPDGARGVAWIGPHGWYAHAQVHGQENRE